MNTFIQFLSEKVQNFFAKIMKTKKLRFYDVISAQFPEFAFANEEPVQSRTATLNFNYYSSIKKNINI